jgi:hypothetical protein
MLHMFPWLHTYVSTVCSQCFICIRRLLQVFYLDIAKVDLDVVYAWMLQAYVFKWFRCLILLFQVFHLYVAYVLMIFKCFLGVLQVF